VPIRTVTSAGSDTFVRYNKCYVFHFILLIPQVFPCIELTYCDAHCPNCELATYHTRTGFPSLPSVVPRVTCPLAACAGHNVPRISNSKVKSHNQVFRPNQNMNLVDNQCYPRYRQRSESVSVICEMSVCGLMPGPKRLAFRSYVVLPEYCCSK